MLKSPLLLLTFCSAFAAESGPFWKVKEKAYARIEAHEILVSVRSEKSAAPPPAHNLTTVGGGQARSSCAFAFQTAQKYERYPEISDYIKKAHFDAEKKLLSMTLAAFGHSADLQIEVLPSSADVEPRRFDFRMVSGPMTGFAGQVQFVSLSPLKCEIGFSGEYKYDEFPIPRLFLEFGMEVVLQKMATRMRGYVEEQWKLSAAPDKGTVK